MDTETMNEIRRRLDRFHLARKKMLLREARATGAAAMVWLDDKRKSNSKPGRKQ